MARRRLGDRFAVRQENFSRTCSMIFQRRGSHSSVLVTVYATSHTGRTHGSDERGSRNLDWDDWGTNDDIRRNWAKIRSGGTGYYKVDVTSDWSPQKIGEDIAAVVGVVLAIIPLIFTGGSRNKSADSNYRLPDGSEGYRPGPVAPEPGPGQLPQPSYLG
jgi:hypothetical protein